MIYFGTLFNINYLSQGLSLFESLKNTTQSFKLFILCLDDVTHQYFLEAKLHEVIPISLNTIENHYPELKEVKNKRTLVEYYFTLSPILPLYILDHFHEVDQITTLDADIYFFSDPTPIFIEMGNNSILITPHKFPKVLKNLEINGLFNVSFQSFKKDDIALKCLTKWKQQCIEWCYDRLEDNRYADQKYLDSWTTDYPGVKILDNKGAGLAPWNAENYEYTLKENNIHVDGEKLIFYHFQGLKFLIDRYLFHGFVNYNSIPNRFILKHIYEPYVISLKRFNHLNQNNTNIRNSKTNWGIFKNKYFGGMLVFNDMDNSLEYLNSYPYRVYVWIRKKLNLR